MKVTFCKEGIDQCDREGGRQDPGAKSNMVILATRTAERASEIQHQGLNTGSSEKGGKEVSRMGCRREKIGHS